MTGKQSRQKLKKIKELLIHISTNNITELNELFYAGMKLFYKKNRCSLKEHGKKHKTWMGNWSGNAEKKSMISNKQTKRKKKHIKYNKQ